eukprot:scaffold505_cov49-Attheya_sp.AAC.3
MKTRMREPICSVNETKEPAIPQGVQDKLDSGALSINPWESTEYKILFGVINDEQSAVEEAICNQLESLEEGLRCNYIQSIHGYKNVKDSPMSDIARTRVHQKCVYMFGVTLENALEKIQDPNEVNWICSCCQSAVDNLMNVPMGVVHLKSEENLCQWYVDFRQNGRRINVPSVSMANLKNDQTK